jgi:nucleoside-diphosphate-sugar epimerase
MWKMMNDERPVIWGDGEQSRDFTFVKDIARANLEAAERRDETNGDYFNVGTGRDVDFNTLVEKLNDVLDKNIEPKHIEHPRDNPVMTTRADNSRAEEMLNWNPEVSFEEGLEKTRDFYEERDITPVD